MINSFKMALKHQKKVNKAIEAQLQKDRKAELTAVKLLLLGKSVMFHSIILNFLIKKNHAQVLLNVENRRYWNKWSDTNLFITVYTD